MMDRISIMKPIHFLLLLALVIMVPVIAQDQDKPVAQAAAVEEAVSYTHLTLPTIYSV